jgi:hypothetical protein
MIASGIHNIGRVGYYSRVYAQIGLNFSPVARRLLTASDNKAKWHTKHKAKPETKRRNGELRRNNKRKRSGNFSYKTRPEETGIPSFDDILPVQPDLHENDVIVLPEPPAKRPRMTKKKNPELYVFSCPHCPKKWANGRNWEKHLLTNGYENVEEHPLPSKEELCVWFKGIPDYLRPWSRKYGDGKLIPFLPKAMQYENC